MTIRSGSFGPAPRSEGQPGGHRFKSCPRYQVRNPDQVNLVGILCVPGRQKTPRVQLEHLRRCEEILNGPGDIPPELFTGHRRRDAKGHRKIFVLEPTPEHGRLNGDADGLVDGVRVDDASGSIPLKLSRHDPSIVIE